MKNIDKCKGAYIGAAIGDAMGGPFEGKHFEFIRQTVGEINGLLDYTVRGPSPGYCMSSEAGNVTDDTFIRRDFTRFLLETSPPRTLETMVDFLLDHADFGQWWAPQVPILISIKQGKADPLTSGATHAPIGGVGWWTPFAILHAGDAAAAAKTIRSFATIWKDPFELNMLGAVMAGLASSLTDDATYESVLATILEHTGPLARKYLERAISIAEKATGVWDLARKMYDRALIFSQPSRGVDGEMPPEIAGSEYEEGGYSTCLYGEQMALAIAAYVYTKGSPDAIPVCCSLGRDSDSTSTMVGAWVGGLNGLSGLPAQWSDTVCQANKPHLDIRDLAERITALEA